MFPRLVNIPKTQSFFLFGARGTGKTELLRSHFQPNEAVFFDLLDPELAARLSAYPNDLLDLLKAELGKKAWVVIDEIQKVPALLDIVHSEISKKRFKFVLTGSSARKLKRGAANLLGGRAVVLNMFPLTHVELGSAFELDRVLALGSLPEIYSLSDEREIKRFLKAYALTYLREEIIEEQIVRNLPPFRRFLDIVGLHITEVVSFTNIARDILSDPKTVQRYYEILEDTLLGFFLNSYEKSLRKQQKRSKKFYFFDTGVARVLASKLDDPLNDRAFEYGQCFENFIVTEIHRLLTYQEEQFKLSFLRIDESQEIDLIVERPRGRIFVCEIKSTDRIDRRHAKNLLNLGREFKGANLILLSRDETVQQFEDVLVLPWRNALQRICEPVAV